MKNSNAVISRNSPNKYLWSISALGTMNSEHRIIEIKEIEHSWHLVQFGACCKDLGSSGRLGGFETWSIFT